MCGTLQASRSLSSPPADGRRVKGSAAACWSPRAGRARRPSAASGHRKPWGSRGPGRRLRPGRSSLFVAIPGLSTRLLREKSLPRCGPHTQPARPTPPRLPNHPPTPPKIRRFICRCRAAEMAAIPRNPEALRRTFFATEICEHTTIQFKRLNSPTSSSNGSNSSAPDLSIEDYFEAQNRKTNGCLKSMPNLI